MDKPREEIIVPPKNDLLQFGDGYEALIVNCMPYVNDEGIEMLEYTIIPHELLKKRYNIRDSELNSSGALVYHVKKIDVLDINKYDASARKFMYVKTYNHTPTEISKRDEYLRNQLEQRDKTIWSMEGDLISMSEQLNLAKSNPQEFIAQGLPLMEQVVQNSINNILVNKKPNQQNTNGPTN